MSSDWRTLKTFYELYVDHASLSYHEFRERWTKAGSVIPIRMGGLQDMPKFMGSMGEAQEVVTYLDKGKEGHCVSCFQQAWVFDQHNFKVKYGSLCQMCINRMKHNSCEHCGHPVNFHADGIGKCIDPHCGCDKLAGDIQALIASTKVKKFPTYEPKKRPTIKERMEAKRALKPKKRKFTPVDLFSMDDIDEEE